MIPIASTMTLSTAANTKTVDLVSGQFQYVGKGVITLVARGSAAGMNASIAVNGVSLIDDLTIPYFGATGGLSMKDHIVMTQTISGGRIQFFLRNTSGGALTTDYCLFFEPSK
jgi:hypothetical protein